ncbi:MAG: cyclase [Herminiimonas sp.]|nr:cyclase [Herminiimonas sp.]
MAGKGQSLNGQDQDDTILIPVTTAQRKLFGSQFPGAVRLLFMQAVSGAAMPAAERDMTQLLRQRHHLQDFMENDFDIRNLTAVANAAADISRVMTLMLEQSPRFHWWWAASAFLCTSRNHFLASGANQITRHASYVVNTTARKGITRGVTIMLGRLATVAALAVGGVILSKKMKSSGGGQRPSSTDATIELDVPLSTAYNQFTQFEEFPQFMTSVQEVKQIDDKHLHWKATVAGKQKEWDAEITQQIPDRLIAWRSTSGVPNEGRVSFQSLGASRTRVTLKMSYTPEDFVEQAGDAMGAVKIQAQQNLSRFKQLLESRGSETGAWRGQVGQSGSLPGAI